MAVLLQSHLRYDYGRPHSPANDRLIFSKGHGAPLLYAMFKAAGVVSDAELLSLRKRGSAFEGHPSPRHLPYVDVATGSLGQGLATAVGMGLTAKHLLRLDARFWVLLGDSEMAEGSVYEALELGGYYGLSNVVAIVDMNRLGQRGPTMVGWEADVYAARAWAFGWDARVVDGQDVEAIHAAYDAAEKASRPTMIVAKTKKGAGVGFLEDKEHWHGKPLSTEEAGRALAELDKGRGPADGPVTTPPPPTRTESSRPASTVSASAPVGRPPNQVNLRDRNQVGVRDRNQVEDRIDAPNQVGGGANVGGGEVRVRDRNQVEDRIDAPNQVGGGANVGGGAEGRAAYQVAPSTGDPEPLARYQVGDPVALARYQVGDPVATRAAFGDALAAVGRLDPRIVTLDGEVSNSTCTDGFAAACPDRFFEMFIAEQAMLSAAAGMNVLGRIPFVATFAAFLTRAHDQIRMADISNATVHVVGSHAGVSIGEDGPSQMGLDDLAMFRGLETSTVLYPCCANATAKLVAEMVGRSGIHYLRTTRAKTPVLYPPEESFPVGGLKVLRRSEEDVALLLAAGITVHEALKAYDILRGRGVSVRVVDVYSLKPIDSAAIRAAATCPAGIVVVEDHRPVGGLADAVAEVFDGEATPRMRRLAVRNMPASATPTEQIEDAGIDAAAIVRAVEDLSRKAAADAQIAA